MKEGADYRRDALMLLEATGTLPEKWQNIPVIDEKDEWIMRAFYDLSSDRAVGMTVGPIPWSSIRRYADYLELNDDEFYFLKHCLAVMDKSYLEYVSKQGANDGKEKRPSSFRP